VTRRDLIKIAGGTALGVGLFALLESRPVVRYLLRARLGDWRVSTSDLDRFLDAFETVYGTPEPLRDDFLRIFVMSTDAFEEGHSGHVLRFTGLYHPYVYPCRNPLARR